jgi:hypothetical protein
MPAKAERGEMASAAVHGTTGQQSTTACAGWARRAITMAKCRRLADCVRGDPGKVAGVATRTASLRTAGSRKGLGGRKADARGKPTSGRSRMGFGGVAGRLLYDGLRHGGDRGAKNGHARTRRSHQAETGRQGLAEVEQAAREDNIYQSAARDEVLTYIGPVAGGAAVVTFAEGRRGVCRASGSGPSLGGGDCQFRTRQGLAGGATGLETAMAVRIVSGRQQRPER